MNLRVRPNRIPGTGADFAERKSITVHHQFTFSSFTPGRKYLIDNFVGPSVTGVTAKNATEAQLIQAHNDWEQWRMSPFFLLRVLS
jgi:hypothetical protein